MQGFAKGLAERLAPKAQSKRTKSWVTGVLDQASDATSESSEAPAPIKGGHRRKGKRAPKMRGEANESGAAPKKAGRVPKPPGRRSRHEVAPGEQQSDEEEIEGGAESDGEEEGDSGHRQPVSEDGLGGEDQALNQEELERPYGDIRGRPGPNTNMPFANTEEALRHPAPQSSTAKPARVHRGRNRQSRVPESKAAPSSVSGVSASEIGTVMNVPHPDRGWLPGGTTSRIGLP